MIAAQIELLGGLDPSPAAGIGTGPNANANAARFAELQTWLQAAADALLAGDDSGALAELATALRKTDGVKSPPDWLAGAAAAAFADAMGCIQGAVAAGGSSVDVVHTLVAPDALAGGSLGPQTIVAAGIGAGGVLSVVGSFPTGGDQLLNEYDQGIAVSPDRRLLFVGHANSKEVEAYGRLADGSLVPAGIVSTTEAPIAIVAHPTLPVIYVSQSGRPATDVGAVTVVAYSPEGLLTPVQTISTVDDLRGIAITGAGTYLVTAHIGFVVPPSLAAYSISGTGTLSTSPVSSADPAGASRIADIVIDAAGGDVYALDLDVGIFAYDFTGGTLTPLNGGAPYPVGAFLADAVVGQGALFALTTHPGSGPSEIVAFPIGPAGLGAPVSLPVADDLQHIVATSDGSNLFASSRAVKQVRSFTVGAGLALTENAGSPFALPGAAGTSTGNLAVSD